MIGMKKFLVLVLPLLLAGCSKDLDLTLLEKNSADEVFAKGKKEMEAGNYSDAVKIFEEFERLYPYSKLMSETQLLAGECNYKLRKYEEASVFFEVFVKTHPTHKEVPYALYRLGMMHYEQMPIIERDQEQTGLSLTYFCELCQRYPKSEFAADAKRKIKDLREQLAGKEVDTARFYQKRGNYVSAINRLNIVVDHYRDTTHTPEAQLRLVECYCAMGLSHEAELVHTVLKRVYPQSKWTRYSEELLLQPEKKPGKNANIRNSRR
jgi:outer membrane protein assembly factor BamD